MFEKFLVTASISEVDLKKNVASIQNMLGNIGKI